MKNNDSTVLEPRFVAAVTTEVFHQLGQITRQLHDALTELGVMSRLQQAASGLPDARSRLGYIARKTGEAADKVLNSVDQAKAEHMRIGDATRRMAQAIVADPVTAVASGAVLNFLRDVEEATVRVDGHLTDIMVAQDFHDLTGQVVAKVVALATDLEDSLVNLLIQTAPAGQAAGAQVPAGQARRNGADRLGGPVVDRERREDVVADQGEVDDLLASLGF